MLTLQDAAPGAPVPEDASKDRFFERVGLLAEEMTVTHGKDFAMGTLVLAARFLAEGKPLGRPKEGTPS